MIKGQEQKSLFSRGGLSQNNLPSLKSSVLHKQYSLNGSPNLTNKPSPSELDLNGQTPLQYINNLPN